MRIVSHPVLCNYYVTYRCNAACGFCDIWEKPSPYITLQNAEENLKALLQQEKNLQDKLKKVNAGVPGRPEKDW